MENEIRLISDKDRPWIDQLIRSGSLSVSDHVLFRTHVEVARIFGRIYKGHQRAAIKLDEFTDVWFPKMYPNGAWNNALSLDGQVITMCHVEDGNHSTVMETDPIRRFVITFGHVEENGQRRYRFLGVFVGAPHLSDKTRWVHQRVADTICFDGLGDFSFVPTDTRPVQDDQLAEVAETDPKIMALAQNQLNAGVFTVDDQSSTTTSRGSYQAIFARRVKDNYGWACAVTGIRTKAFLVAFHIVPWAVNKEMRLDPTNGICLSAFVDRAFDAGYLTITPMCRTSVRWDKVEDDPILKLELARIDDVELFKPTADPPDPAKLAQRIDLGY